uniref:Major facilitator superfamily (MFS) profile domain-containing protein n=1 Tax=Salix viminalis TaxID=40686 RepID=A0A6N2KKA6_SALVM
MDKIGRKSVYGITLMLMMISSIGSSLLFWEFWLGFRIRGDYPLSAAIMVEYSKKKTCRAFIVAIFAMQGFGILVGGIVAIVVSATFHVVYKALTYLVDPIGSSGPQADYVWTIILMLGALPVQQSRHHKTIGALETKLHQERPFIVPAGIRWEAHGFENFVCYVCKAYKGTRMPKTKLGNLTPTTPPLEVSRSNHA